MHTRPNAGQAHTLVLACSLGTPVSRRAAPKRYTRASQDHSEPVMELTPEKVESLREVMFEFYCRQMATPPRLTPEQERKALKSVDLFLKDLNLRIVA